ncbi:coiled-coil domain-containing protein [Burkholderia gladioli]|uniref:coiled-coil domain-containing protein n=1 Tax=Burkholderia gladioli TaxID=28095 RepID=UPI0012D304FF|nr:hypothetical protein [Burkholderia gladioli]
MPIMTVTTTIAALKNTIDLAKTAIAARDEIKLAEMQQSINDRVIDVQNAALGLQEKQSAARDEIDELKDELRVAQAKIEELTRTLGERAAYKLHAVSASGFAYQFVGEDQPDHLICQPCYDGPEHRKLVLKFNRAGPYNSANYMCPSCRNVIHV